MSALPQKQLSRAEQEIVLRRIRELGEAILSITDEALQAGATLATSGAEGAAKDNSRKAITPPPQPTPKRRIVEKKSPTTPSVSKGPVDVPATRPPSVSTPPPHATAAAAAASPAPKSAPPQQEPAPSEQIRKVNKNATTPVAKARPPVTTSPVVKARVTNAQGAQQVHRDPSNTGSASPSPSPQQQQQQQEPQPFYNQKQYPVRVVCGGASSSSPAALYMEPSLSNIDAFIKSKPKTGDFDDILRRHKNGDAAVAQNIDNEEKFHSCAPVYDLSNSVAATKRTRLALASPPVKTLTGMRPMMDLVSQSTMSAGETASCCSRRSPSRSPTHQTEIRGYYNVVYIHQHAGNGGKGGGGSEQDAASEGDEPHTRYVRAVFTPADELESLQNAAAFPTVIYVDPTRSAALCDPKRLAKAHKSKHRSQTVSPSPCREDWLSTPLQRRIQRLHSWRQAREAAVMASSDRRRRRGSLLGSSGTTPEFYYTSVKASDKKTTKPPLPMAPPVVVEVSDRLPSPPLSHTPPGTSTQIDVLLTPSPQRQRRSDAGADTSGALEVVVSSGYNRMEWALAGAARYTGDEFPFDSLPTTRRCMEAADITSKPIALRLGK